MEYRHLGVLCSGIDGVLKTQQTAARLRLLSDRRVISDVDCGVSLVLKCWDLLASSRVQGDMCVCVCVSFDFEIVIIVEY